MKTIPFTLAKRTGTTITAAPAAPEGQVMTRRAARLSGLGQPQYLANTLDVQRIQNSLRSAERGDTWLLMTIFRDMVATYGHLQTEWGKRRCVITGNAEVLIPHDADDEDDKVACEVIAEMIEGCRNWFDGLQHLLDGTLYPLAAAEKIFEAVGSADNAELKHPLRYRLKEIAPIDHILECYKIPYLPSFGRGGGAANQSFDPDDWESWLRFYSTSPEGSINFSMIGLYEPNRDHHIIHRGNMLSPSTPPNFGGHMRTILFWWLLSTQGRDWWALMMQKYGMPIPTAHVNVQQADTVAFMQQALALCAQLGGLIVDQAAQVEWAQVAGTDSSQAHKLFQDWCDANTSKVVIGQTLSAKADKSGGMGSGFAQQSEEIREDIRKQDTIKLADTLQNQLFRQFLRINGYRGNPPSIRWGGMRSGEAATFSKTQAQMFSAGMRPTERGVRTINELMGVEYELDPNASQPGAAKMANPQDKENNNPVKYS